MDPSSKGIEKEGDDVKMYEGFCLQLSICPSLQIVLKRSIERKEVDLYTSSNIRNNKATYVIVKKGSG